MWGGGTGALPVAGVFGGSVQRVVNGFTVDHSDMCALPAGLRGGVSALPGPVGPCVVGLSVHAWSVDSQWITVMCAPYLGAQGVVRVRLSPSRLHPPCELRRRTA
ncbi:hypothetical protein K504DRAFT_47855 [Pleomassaria siparia CBS 279.74]|uniref:Uncharacterized protein n=1 Tax=Pleomassaria siparia CBS 279.74 TaxID=1314801 RepID=A0A6G1JQ81_9PLEO|nr:hypothetical protein K504DRAFT_47855 [Pleomassaria siparia CBS 279.74]